MNPKPHDFTKPARLSAVWHERLLSWSRAALVLANKTWAKQLPLRLEAEVSDWEGLYGQQALSQLPEPFLAYRVMVGESRFPTLLVMPRKLMLNLVGAMLGDEENATSIDRELTLVEENLGDYFLTEYWLSAFRESWPAAHPATWVLEERETNPATSRTYGANEVLMSLNWKIRGSWGETNGVWLFPRKGLLSALGNTEKTTDDLVTQPVPADRRESVVQALPMVVQVVLGTTELKLSELRLLQVGDVLMLDESNENQAVAHVGSRALYRGRVGRSGTWKAFQIKSILEK
jgi:flagellar motor switch protein FliM